MSASLITLEFNTDAIMGTGMNLSQTGQLETWKKRYNGSLISAN
jgi:hypothetical protein